MKKSALISLFLMIVSLFMFTSCSQNPNFSGEFSEEEFVYSVGKEVDFFDELNLSGISKDEVELSLSSDIALKSENTYKMTKPGKAILSAKLGDLVLASAVVVVKDNFPIPQNLQVREDGRVTWDEVFSFFEGEFFKTDSYTVVVNGQANDNVRTNSFSLPGEGVYSIMVKANTGKYFDESEYASLVDFDYRHMLAASEINLTSSTSIGGNMTLSWKDVPGGNYDVFISGVKVASGIDSEELQLNFSNFAGGKNIPVAIIVNDNQNKIFSSRTEVLLSKPADLSPSIVMEGGDGIIRWRDAGGKDKYIVEYISSNNPAVRGTVEDDKLERRGGFIYCKLEGVNAGEYNIRVQAKGGVANERFYVDTNIASLNNVQKLNKPEYTYAFDEQGLLFEFAEVEGVTKVCVEAGDRTEIVDLTQTRTHRVPLNDLDSDSFQVKIRSLPDDKNQISSDNQIEEFFKLGEIQNFKHTLVDCNSVLTFDKLDNADLFEIWLNGQKLDDFGVKEILEGEITKTEITISNLADFTPIGNAYKFELKVSRKDGRSNLVETEKAITILGKPSKNGDRVDGLFEWTSLGESGIAYDYTIFASDAAQTLGSELKKGSTQNLVINEEDKLEFGYYIIKVEGKSLDTDKYLDSDFGGYVANNFMQEPFHVEKQIESPHLVLEERGDKYVLKISKVDYAGKYLVSMNDVLLSNGTIVPSTDNEYYECPIDSTLPDDNGKQKTYKFSVVASVKDGEDSVLHPKSDTSILQVIRLPIPTFTTTIGENQEKEIEEKLSVTLPQGAEKVEIRKDGVLANPDGSNEISLNTIVGLTPMTFQFIAKARKENENIMYLDSQLSELAQFDFKRLDVPENLNFDTGNITFTNKSHEHVQKYIISLTLVNSVNGNKVWKTETTQLSFNLNDYVESMRENSEFSSDYANASQILVSISAYNFDFDENVFYLPSAFSQGYVVEKLDAPSISFDVTERKLSWDKVEKEGITTYSIYIDGKKYKEDLTGLSETLADVDFIAQKEIVVYAENPRYLSSAYSNKIVVRQLQPLDTMRVAGNTMSTTIGSDDLNQVERLEVNGASFDFNKTSGEVNIDLSKYETSELDLALKLVATSERQIGDVTYYYISSDSRSFKLYDLSKQEGQASKDNEKISWPALAADFKGMSSTNPLSYNLIISRQNGVNFEQVEVLSKLKENEILFEDERIFKLTPASYRMSVEGVLDSYSLSASTGNAVGYFGKKDLGSVDLKKVEGIGDYSYKLISASGNLIEQRRNGDLQITWQDVWGNGKNTLFDVDVDLSTLPEEYESYKDQIAEMFKNLHDGSSSNFILNLLGIKYSLKLSGGQYVFTLSSTVADMVFYAGRTDVPIFVHTDGNIRSTPQELEIERLYPVSDARVSSDGVLSFYPVRGADRYIISLKINEETTQYFETNQTSFNLMPYIQDKTGAYYISILADDTTNSFLPANDLLTFEGRRLQGVTSVVLSETGEVTFTIADEGESQGLVFVANYNGVIKEFLPRADENVANTYHFSTAEFVDLFGGNINDRIVNIELSVKLEGKINSIGKAFSFAYDRETLDTLVQKRGIDFVDGKLVPDKTKNYLVMFDKISSTTGIWMEYRYITIPEPDGDDDENYDPTPILNIVKLSMSASSLRGYWITTLDGREYFSQLSPAIEVASMEECFALDIDETLKDLDEGEYHFFISRVCKENNIITQYGVSIRVYTKLPKINQSLVRLEQENLVWKGVDDTRIASYNISLYTREDDEYKLFTKREVTSTTNFDLTRLISDSTKNYYLTITALPSADNFENIPSLPTSIFTVRRFDSPSKLENENGVLQYNLESIKAMQLLKDIEDNVENYHELGSVIANKTYSEPFTFSIDTILSANVRLKFTQVENKVEGRSFYLTMKAIDLLANELNNLTFVAGASMSYLTVLENASDSSSVEQADRIKLRTLVSAIKGSKFGLANSQILFDDYGRHIPAGNYNVYIRQEGIAFENVNREGTLPSQYSNFAFVNIVQAPDIKLDREGTGVYKYYLSFKPVETQIKESDGSITTTIATNYKMNLRAGNIIKEFLILNQGGEWRLYYQNEGQDETYFVLTSGKFGEYITIDLSKDFARKIDGLKNQDWQVAIYAEGNNFSLNSKTDEVSMSLLDFDWQSLRLDNGVLSWNSAFQSGTRVTYRAINSVAEQLPTITGIGQQSLSLPGAGQYEYIIFMACGSYSENAVVVDSESYKLENLYVRAQPNVSVENGSFLLSNNRNEDSRFVSFSQFNITNDLAKRTGAMTKTNRLEGPGQIIAYLPGNYQSEIEGSDDYTTRLLELDATSFEFTSAGNSIELDEANRDKPHFEAQKTQDDQADFLLSINSLSSTTVVLLQSDAKIIPAKMLPEISEARLENGNLVWDNITESDGFKALEEGKQVLYKVMIYYYKSGDADATSEKVETFLTKENKLSTLVISNDSQYTNYSISITTLASDQEDEANTNGIKYADGAYVLTSTEKVFGDKLLRKIDAVDSVSIEDKDLKIKYYASATKAEVLFKVFDSTGREIKGQIRGKNNRGQYQNDYLIEHEGTTPFFYAYFTPDDGELVYGAPYSLSVYAYRPGVQSLERGAFLMSHAKAVESDVYKAKNIQGDDVDFTFDIQSNLYRLDFQRYFESYQILRRKDLVKIAVTFTTQRGELTSEVLSDKPYLHLQVNNDIQIPQIVDTSEVGVVQIPEGVHISFEVSKNQDANSPLVILGSDTSDSFTLGSTEFSASDAVDWNGESQHVVWTSTRDFIGKVGVKGYRRTVLLTGEIQMDEIEAHEYSLGESIALTTTTVWYENEVYVMSKLYDGASPIYFKQNDLSNEEYLFYQDGDSLSPRQYMVVVFYENGDIDSAIIEGQTQDDLFYQPSLIGNIVEMRVYVKNGKFDLYSKPLAKVGSFRFNIFAGGTGVQNDPYIITTEEQFKNIVLRNSQTQKYYFALGNNINLTLDSEKAFVVDTFYGDLDCRGYTISLGINGTRAIEPTSMTFPPTTPQPQTYSFTQSAGLFERIDANARVANLKLNLELNLSGISSSTAISPIALNNYGLIENLEILSLNNNLSMESVQGLSIAMSGVVCKNYGTINNVQNKAGVNFSANGSVAPNLVYAGIALQNENAGMDIASINNCISSGEVLILARAGQNNARLFGAGIVGNVLLGSEINNCGNDSNITLRGQGVTGFTPYAGGVAIRVNNGYMQNCFNNGQILTRLQRGTTIENTTTSNVGGIAYSIQNAEVTGLVETSSTSDRLVKIAQTCRRVDGSECYASDPVTGLSSQVPRATQTSAVNGYVIVIEETEAGLFHSSLKKV